MASDRDAGFRDLAVRLANIMVLIYLFQNFPEFSGFHTLCS